MIIADPAKSFNASLGQGLRMGQGVQQMNRQNKLYDLYETHGQGIMQGDPNALAALAQVDPVQAFNLNSKVSANSRSSQIDEARLAQIKQETAFAAAKEAERLTAAERAAEAQETARVASSARAAYEQGPEAFSALVAQNAPALQEAGIDPNTVTYETWPMIEAGLIGAVEGLTAGVEAAQGGDEPASIEALRIRAREAGLQEGTEAYQEFMRRGGKIPNGMVIRTRPDGTMEFVQGEGVDGASFDFSEQESKDVVFATRAEGALGVLEPFADELTSRVARAAEADPTGLAREFLQSDEFQVALQAGQEFLQAILRKDTGAAITPSEEYLYGRTYLPQPGDKEAVLRAKKDARARALAALKAGMSPEQILAQERALGVIEVPDVTLNQDTGAGQQGSPQTPAGNGAELPPAPEGFSEERWRGVWEYMTEEDRELFR